MTSFQPRAARPTRREMLRALVMGGVGIASSGAAVGTLAGCTEAPPSGNPFDPKTKAPTPTPGLSATITVTPSTTPASLVQAMTAFYRGGAVDTTPDLADAAALRVPAQGAITATAQLGTWRGTPYAVVTAGSDVTFLLQTATGWRVVAGWWAGLGLTAPAIGAAPRVVLAVTSAAGAPTPSPTGPATPSASPANPAAGAVATPTPGSSPTAYAQDVVNLVGVDGRGGIGLLRLPGDLWLSEATGDARVGSVLAAHGAEALAAAVQASTPVMIRGYLASSESQVKAALAQLAALSVPVRSATGSTLTSMGGDKVLEVSRARYALPTATTSLDFGVGALLVCIGGAAALGAMGSLTALLDAVAPSIDSNLDAAAMLVLIAAAIKADPGRVLTATVSGTTQTRDGQPVIIPDAAGTKRLVDISLGAVTP